MNFTRSRKVPTHGGEGLALRWSGTALILIGVVLALGSLAIFGFTSPVLYVFLAIAAALGAIGLRRNYLGVAFTEIEHRLGLPESER